MNEKEVAPEEESRKQVLDAIAKSMLMGLGANKEAQGSKPWNPALKNDEKHTSLSCWKVLQDQKMHVAKTPKFENTHAAHLI